MVSTSDSATSLFPLQHQTWRYTIRGLDDVELVMFSSTPLSDSEAAASIRMHFGGRLVALRPGGGT